MNKNSLLSIANVFCQLFKYSIGISVIILTVVFVHFQFDRDSYKEWKFEQSKNDSFIRIVTESSPGEKTNYEEKLLSDWNMESLYFNYFKFTAILILLFLSINQFIAVLKSVRELKTFHQTNVKALKRIGNYTILIGALSIFDYWEFNNYAVSSFSISFDIFFIALIAFILAEVFKEGNNMREENQLTI